MCFAEGLPGSALYLVISVVGRTQEIANEPVKGHRTYLAFGQEFHSHVVDMLQLVLHGLTYFVDPWLYPFHASFCGLEKRAGITDQLVDRPGNLRERDRDCNQQDGLKNDHNRNNNRK